MEPARHPGASRHLAVHPLSGRSRRLHARRLRQPPAGAVPDKRLAHAGAVHARRQIGERRVTWPFTRFLAGPGDFTPGGFVNRPPERFQTNVSPTQVQCTRAGQLALFVAYDSPVMCVCDHPSNLRGQPGIDFLRLVPTVWDETRVLSGVVAEHLVMARRSGPAWYLGALNNSYARVRSVKLDFLDRPGRWRARWWHDAADSAENAEHIVVEERDVSAQDTLDLRMAPGGGAVMRFVSVP